jgi:DNA mismatch repair ATPase MutS
MSESQYVRHVCFATVVWSAVRHVDARKLRVRLRTDALDRNDEPPTRLLRAQAACKAAWAQLLERFAPHCAAFRAAARALAALDCLQALAGPAQAPDTCRPHFIENADAAEVRIEAGRAPLLDAVLPGGAVPNDVALGGAGLSTMVISGPNMGGKSCYMCQARRCQLLQHARKR